MRVASNEFLILNSRLNIQSYSRTRTSGETSSSRRRPPFLLLLVLLSTAGRRLTNHTQISSSSYMCMYYSINKIHNFVFFLCVIRYENVRKYVGRIFDLRETSTQSGTWTTIIVEYMTQIKKTRKERKRKLAS